MADLLVVLVGIFLGVPVVVMKEFQELFVVACFSCLVFEWRV